MEKLCQWNGMESAKTKLCTYRNLVFEFSGERMHCSMNWVKVICYQFGKTYIFIPHIIYKNKF